MLSFITFSVAHSQTAEVLKVYLADLRAQGDNMKKILFVIWTAICIVLTGVLIWQSNSASISTGSDINLTINDSSHLTVDADTATLEAASSDFFVLRNVDGQTIVGVQTAKPLGWAYDDYYTSPPTPIQSGTWIVEKGHLTIHLYSPSDFVVRQVLNLPGKIGLSFAAVLSGFVIWIVLLAFYYSRMPTA